MYGYWASVQLVIYLSPSDIAIAPACVSCSDIIVSISVLTIAFSVKILPKYLNSWIWFTLVLFICVFNGDRIFMIFIASVFSFRFPWLTNLIYLQLEELVSLLRCGHLVKSFFSVVVYKNVLADLISSGVLDGYWESTRIFPSVKCIYYFISLSSMTQWCAN